MGLMSKIKSRRKEEKELEEEQNPYGTTSMPKKEGKFDAFRDYANARRAEQPQYRPKEEIEDLNLNSGPTQRYEETYEEYKQRVANEEKEKKILEQQRLHAQRVQMYGQQGQQGQYDEEDLNDMREFDFEAPGPKYDDDDVEEDLNALPGEMSQMQIQEEEQRNESEEELEDIKGELSFTRDKTLESTRQTIRMAQEAEISAQNTMGMLGSQSERLAGSESQVRLSKTKAKLADETAKELRTVSNLIQAPKNPFNKGRRLRVKEQQQMAEMISDQAQRDKERNEYLDSERRVKSVLGGPGYGRSGYSTGGKKYKTREEALRSHQQYLFDGEGEGEREKELQIGENIDIIGDYATRLKKMALAQGEELDKQEVRLGEIGNNVDNLSIGVAQTTMRLNNIIKK